ncbi:DotA/TraY family protein (plasmid) [Vibrio parahaemolyticus]|uniref:DotA/TraY family protein n=10 Tax=Vibrio TaxID=662 RepID=A0AA47JMT0_VIBPH|nr:MULTISPECIES: DotA/TraY family protein [Vibrio]MBO0148589.1 DotA/TraY family protein [Vibrio sp. Vb2424]MDW1516551.1 DotA/TraY family protein [Vibrio sp. Vb5035]MDW1546680.1 DotA/TraY family protein [Vibrio sp. Vb5034]MDW2371157.1 DotA/TraY family protein [Vibrio sp. 1078-1]WAT93736.1 DotA/TraY family protein [Vibrio parahaemolyticus]
MATCADFTLTCIEAHVQTGSTTNFLAILFGGWVHHLFGNQSVEATLTPLMVMLGGLNFLALLYGSINVIYNSGHIMMNAAATGHVFGKMSPYVPLRIAIALGSLAPMIHAAGSFVSVGQASGMYVIVHGAGAADVFWKAGVNDYVNHTGAQIASTNVGEVFSVGETMVSMLSCAELFESSNDRKFTLKSINSNGTSSIFPTDSFPSFSRISSMYPNSSGSSSSLNYVDEPIGKNGAENTGAILEFRGGACGSIRFDFARKPTASSSVEQKLAYYSNYYGTEATFTFMSELHTLVSSMLSRLKNADLSKYVTAMRRSDDSYYREYLLNELGSKELAENLFKAHVDLAMCKSKVVERGYMGELSQSWQGQYEASRCGSSKANISISGSSSLVEELTEGGWMMAPLAFSRMNGMMQLASSGVGFSLDNVMSTNIPERTSFCRSVFSWIPSINLFDSSLDDEIDEANECKTYWLASNFPKFTWNLTEQLAMSGDIKSDWPEAQKLNNWSALMAVHSTNENAKAAATGNESAIVSVASGILSSALSLGNYNGNLASAIETPGMSGIDYDGALFDVTGSTNALALLSTLGEALKNIWYIVVLATEGADVIKGALESSALSAPFAIPLAFFVKTVAPLVVSSLIGAFILGNVLPMVPIITFLFVVTAFFIICAEALAGIALGSALLSSAAGEGLMAVHGLRMAALYGAIFLRPTLHVIGLMLGFAMCNLSLAFLNSVWWKSIGVNLPSSWDLFDLVMLTGGYPIVLFGLLVYCLKAPNLFANNLMSWVATDAIGQFGDSDQYLSATNGTFNKMSDAFNGSLQKQQPQQDQQGNGNNGSGNNGNGNTGNGEKSERPPSASK